MTNKKFKKEKRAIPTRERGEVIQPVERPSQSLFSAVLKAEQDSSPTSTGPTSSTSLTGLTNLTITNSSEVVRQAVSPERDFTKTPNSVVRLIVAQGLFKGKSKQIYDYAWSVSRGAINPQRTFRKTQAEIKKGSGIGSLNTIKDGIKHLELIGLFKKIDSKVGEREGSEFEIFTPEELDYTSSTGLTGLTGSTELAQKVVELVEPEIGLTGLTQTIGTAGESVSLRHSFKDFDKNDDERFRIFQKLESAAREKTGRNLTKKDYLALLDVFDLLIAETEIAAARTNSISAYIPFMAENLRRRLHAKPKVEKKGTEVKKDTVGKTTVSTPEPLNEESRMTLLKTYQEGFAEYGMEWVDQNETFFTPEDWQWLKSNLETPE